MAKVKSGNEDQKFVSPDLIPFLLAAFLPWL